MAKDNATVEADAPDKDTLTAVPTQMVQLSLEQLDEMWAARTEKLIKALGLTEVDTKHGMFPGIEGGDDPDLTKLERIGQFFKGAVLGQGVVQDVAILKALSEGTDSAGGYFVPTDFRLDIIMRINTLSQLYPRVRKFTTNRDSISFPSLATDVSITWGRAENADFTESDPVLGQTTFTVRNMNALTYSSRELFADSAVNVASFLTELFADAISRERDRVINIGSVGLGEPEGIYSATITQSVDVGGSLTFAKLVDIETELSPQYRPNASWIMGKTNVGRVRKLSDDNGQPIFNRNVPGAAAGTLIGYPILYCDDLPDSTIFLGDLNKYWWMDREQMGFESTTQGGTAWLKHQVGLKVWERCDGKIVLVAAFASGLNITA